MSPLESARALVPIALAGAICFTTAGAAQGQTPPPADPRAPAAPARQLVELRVVDGKSGAPIEGAAVRRIDGNPKGAPLPDDDEFVRIEEEFRGRPVVAKSDAKGCVRFERPAGQAQALLTFDAGGRFAAMFLWEHMPATQDVKLFPDPPLRVEVRDAGGRAMADVPIVLRDRSNPYSYDILWARTGADGRVTLPHAAYAVNKQGSDLPEHTRWSVAVATCLREVVAHSWEGAPPEELVKLVMPDTGQVEVLLQEMDGTPLRGEIEVALIAVPNPCAASETEEQSVRSLDGAFAPRWVAGPRPGIMLATAREGRASFDHVGLGLSLAAGVARNRGSMVVTTRGSGPEKASDVVALTIVFGSTTPTFAARVVGLDGELLRDVDLQVELFLRPPKEGWNFVNRGREDVLGPMTRGAALGPALIRTDAQGGFRVDYMPEQASKGNAVLLVQHGAGEAGHAVMVVELAELWTPGIHDLGELQLERAPIAAAGRVVDDLGAPVDGASVSISEFKAQSRIATVTRADGRFELRGVAFQKAIDLSVDKEGYSFAWQNRVTPGTTDLEIVLPTSCELRAKVILPAGTSPHDFGVTIQPIDPAQSGGMGTGLQDDGSLQVDGLRPGTYRLEIRANRRSLSVFSKEGLVIARGKPLDLGTIDLAGEVKPITLKILDPEGKPLSGIYFLPDEEREPNKVFAWADKDLWTCLHPDTFSDGTLRLLPKSESVRVDLAAAGFRIEHVTLSADRELRMRPGLPVRLVLDKRVGEAPEGWEFAVMLVSTAKDRPHPLHGQLPFESSAFDVRGEATLAAPGTGKYWFEWVMRKRLQGGRWARSWPEAKQQIEVIESDKEQRLVLHPQIDPGDFTLEELEKQR
jgi:hypothetical protein